MIVCLFVEEYWLCNWINLVSPVFGVVFFMNAEMLDESTKRHYWGGHRVYLRGILKIINQCNHGQYSCERCRKRHEMARNGSMRPVGVYSLVLDRLNRINWQNVCVNRLSRTFLVIESEQICQMVIVIGRKISIFFVSPGVQLCWQRISLWTVEQISLTFSLSKASEL